VFHYGRAIPQTIGILCPNEEHLEIYADAVPGGDHLTVAELIEKLKTMPQDMDVRRDDHGVQSVTVTSVCITVYIFGPDAGKPFVEIQ
jgi:hypothetical protein